jgi:hypothetical protein
MAGLGSLGKHGLLRNGSLERRRRLEIPVVMGCSLLGFEMVIEISTGTEEDGMVVILAEQQRRARALGGNRWMGAAVMKRMNSVLQVMIIDGVPSTGSGLALIVMVKPLMHRGVGEHGEGIGVVKCFVNLNCI